LLGNNADTGFGIIETQRDVGPNDFKILRNNQQTTALQFGKNFRIGVLQVATLRSSTSLGETNESGAAQDLRLVKGVKGDAIRLPVAKELWDSSFRLGL
jgi:hypothetical protein